MNASFSLRRFGVISRMQQSALVGVLGRVERRQLVAERQVVAVRLDDLADVVALERNRDLDERPAHRVAVRPRLLVVVHGGRFFVPRDEPHVPLRVVPDRALLADPVVVRVGVLGEVPVAEQVDVGEIGGAHCGPPATIVDHVRLHGRRATFTTQLPCRYCLTVSEDLFLPEPEPREVKYTVISVDDHVVEPPHMFEGRLPAASCRTGAPKIVETDKGHEVWEFEGQIYTPGRHERGRRSPAQRTR